METFRIPLRVVFYRDEDNDWIAHCLEFDLCGHGKDHESAAELLSQAITHQIIESLENNDPSILFNPAPGNFFQMFAAGKDSVMAEIKINVEFKDQGSGSFDMNDVTARDFSGNCLEMA